MKNFLLSIICFALIVNGGYSSPEKLYGVFIGTESTDAGIIEGYYNIVIDAAEYSKEDIKILHKKNKNIYSYLNIGSIENYREYYSRFKDITLGVYENWEDEEWVDVSQKKWKKFIVDELALSLKKKGIDGFFIDNTDVYYMYQNQKIYKGVLDILKGLKKYKLPVIINGGDMFIEKALDRGELGDLVSGVNQESVFTYINFDTGSYGINNDDDCRYFKKYLERCKKGGLEVYMIEYGADEVARSKVQKYCMKNGFYCYFASSIELDLR